MEPKKHTGSKGTATEVLIPDEINDPRKETTISQWMIQVIPRQNAFWDHYVLALLHLRTAANMPPARKQYPGAEYEILAVALDPFANPSPENISSIRFLQPVNMAIQFDGVTDGQAAKILEACAVSVVEGRLPLEGIFSIDQELQPSWRWAIHRALENVKGGQDHADI